MVRATGMGTRPRGPGRGLVFDPGNGPHGGCEFVRGALQVWDVGPVLWVRHNFIF